jgi:cytochrome P450
LIADPTLIPGAVEEFLRMYSVANPVRRALRDINLSGATMKANDRIYVSIACANYDPTEFSDGVRFDREVNRHLAFASGPHRCLGSHLARHELGVALQEWLNVIPDFRVRAGSIQTYLGPIFSMGSLTLEWDV